MKYAAITGYSSIGQTYNNLGNDLNFIRKLEEEKARWAKHGIEMTGDHIDWAEEYATMSGYTFFGALGMFFDQLQNEINVSVQDCKPVEENGISRFLYLVHSERYERYLKLMYGLSKIWGVTT